jgi:hypothetical protein
MEINLDALVSAPKHITLGGRVFEIEDIKIGQSFKVMAMYNHAQKMLMDDGLKRIANDERYALKYMNKMISVCLHIVRPIFSKQWFKLIGINRRWFYKNTNQTQLQQFVKEVMSPLLDGDKGEKKKT